MSDSTAVTVATPASHAPVSVFTSMASFESAQRMAKALVTSDLVPDAYRGENKVGNALIAMDMAQRMGLSPMVVMQNLHIISGRPSWSSAFIISALNSSGMFSPLRFKVTPLGKRKVDYDTWEGPKGNRHKVKKTVEIDDVEFVAYAVERGTGEILEGPPVSYSTAVKEGWFTKPDSKWQTMPELMGRYRAAAFFGRLYAPHILNGMQTDEEVLDVDDFKVVSPAPAAVAKDEPAKPDGRPAGIHAAMNRGKAETPKKTTSRVKPAAEPEPQPEPEQEVEEVEAEVVGEAEAADDGVPFDVDHDDGDGDDGYEPA
ncbi:hypothetical protein [Aureimonas sp. AU40]|uniref:hypothetical protein n=1 Tax=Aureimonas sp. AU40 TaxID=1637747 RepID=UPI000780889C|nr:hypothetical protein [Aureimonas sp. AU40]